MGYIDLIGQKFGKLTVIEEVKTAKHLRFWLCKCDCGKLKEVRQDNLRNGITKSCGCLRKTHGLTRTRLYRTWAGTKNICCGKNNQENGLEIYKEWKYSFMAFREWAINNGYFDNLELDRINKNIGYFPDNCRWVTHRQNCTKKKEYKNNKSGYVGVSFYKANNKWLSQITTNKGQIYLGIHKTKELALEARNKYIIKNNLQDDYRIQK